MEVKTSGMWLESMEVVQVTGWTLKTRNMRGSQPSQTQGNLTLWLLWFHSYLRAWWPVLFAVGKREDWELGHRNLVLMYLVWGRWRGHSLLSFAASTSQETEGTVPISSRGFFRFVHGTVMNTLWNQISEHLITMSCIFSALHTHTEVFWGMGQW